MPYYTYVIKSTRHHRLYIGSCMDVLLRLKQHNAGKVRSTKAYKPWTMVRAEEHPTRSLARKRELQLKQSGVARKQLKNHPETYMPPSSIG